VRKWPKISCLLTRLGASVNWLEEKEFENTFLCNMDKYLEEIAQASRPVLA